jgi:hypothetical protein
LSGYIDLVGSTEEVFRVIDFKTDAPPISSVEQTYPEYAAQALEYGRLLAASGLLGDRKLSCGLLFTADGAIRWIAPKSEKFRCGCARSKMDVGFSPSLSVIWTDRGPSFRTPREPTCGGTQTHRFRARCRCFDVCKCDTTVILEQSRHTFGHRWASSGLRYFSQTTYAHYYAHHTHRRACTGCSR